MAVANPLEMQDQRRVANGQHVVEGTTYVPVYNFEPAKYPKWLYKGNKSKLAMDEVQEVHLAKDGWSAKAPQTSPLPKEE